MRRSPAGSAKATGEAVNLVVVDGAHAKAPAGVPRDLDEGCAMLPVRT